MFKRLAYVSEEGIFFLGYISFRLRKLMEKASRCFEGSSHVWQIWKGPWRIGCLLDGHLCKEMDWEESGMLKSSSLTSLVFHRCLSFGSEVHFGRHSSSFLGRYIFKCPCSSATRATQNRIFSTGFKPYWLARLPPDQAVSLSVTKRSLWNNHLKPN